MSELLPLLESSADDFERELLLAARRELPKSSGLRETALGLGLGAAAALTLTTSLSEAELLRSSAVPAAGPGAANSVTSPSAVGSQGLSQVASLPSAGAGTSVSLTVIAKFVAGAAIASLVAIASVEQARTAAPSPALSRQIARPAITAAARASAFVPTLEPDSVQSTEHFSPAKADEAEPSKRVPVFAKRRSPTAKRIANVPASSARGEASTSDVARASNLPQPPSAAPSSVLPSSSLAAEVQLLDRARAALAASDPRRASALMDQYAASKPSGVLAQEAALLRVRSLLALGDRAGAVQLARRIVRDNPGSRHVALLAELAAE